MNRAIGMAIFVAILAGAMFGLGIGGFFLGYLENAVWVGFACLGTGFIGGVAEFYLALDALEQSSGGRT